MPASIVISQSDNVHDALRDRRRPLNIKVTKTSPPGVEPPQTDFIESIGRRDFSIAQGRDHAVSQLTRMLRHHPQPARIDGINVRKMEPASEDAHVTLTGNAARYPHFMVSDLTIVPGHGSVIIDGVTYAYAEYQTQRNRTRLGFTYLTADATTDPEHPNYRRVFRLQGAPSLQATATVVAGAGPPAQGQRHHGSDTLRIAHGRKGSPMQKQAQRQQEKTQSQHQPVSDDTTLYQLWEPYNRHLDERAPGHPSTADDVHYFNMCILEDEERAVYLERSDERHNAAAAYALWRNPQLGLTPVMRRCTKAKPSAYPQSVRKGAILEKATAVTLDGQIWDLMNNPGKTAGFVRPASSIKLTLRIQEPGSISRTIVAPAPLFFDGAPGAEQIWFAPDSGLMPDQGALACLIENAYWDKGWQTAGCEHHNQRRARTDALARRCTVGELEAFKIEVERAAESFQPVAEPPNQKVSRRRELPNGGNVTVTYRPPSESQYPPEHSPNGENNPPSQH